MLHLVKLDILTFLVAVTACEDEVLKHIGVKFYQNGGMVFVLQKGNETLAWAMLRQRDESFWLVRIYTPPRLRRRGYALALIRELQKEGVTINCNVDRNNAPKEAIKSLLQKAGFRMYDSVYYFKIPCKEFVGWGRVYDAQRIELCVRQYLQKKVRLLTFAEASGEQLDYIKNAGKNAFQSVIDPKWCFTERVKICREGSFILLKNNLPVAFAILSNSDSDTFIFEIVSTAKEFIGRGYAFVLYYEVVVQFLRQARFKNCYLKYFISENNVASLKMQERFVGQFSKKKVLQDYFKWESKECN